MLLKYVGSKPLPYRLNTPIPFLSKSNADHGVLEFMPECDVPNHEWVQFLLTQCGSAFERVENQPSVPEPAPAVVRTNPFLPLSEAERAKRHIEKVQATLGKKFRGKPGKWQAQSFLRRHRLTEEIGLKKLQIGTKVMHWECVPIALADVKVGLTDVEPIPA